MANFYLASGLDTFKIKKNKECLFYSNGSLILNLSGYRHQYVIKAVDKPLDNILVKTRSSEYCMTAIFS